MKRIFLFITLLLSVLTFQSCVEEEQTSSHETQWSADGKDSVVHVRYQDENGNFNNFFMNYLLFRMLFDNGGYTNVNNYYRTHPQEFSQPTRYQNYTTRADAKTTPYSGTSTSSPSRETKSYSSPARKSSTPSYSSPSRSSGSSYSSPSRSTYSSPSRSYSSPSRSTYSSPSRSYSSPSRGH